MQHIDKYKKAKDLSISVEAGWFWDTQVRDGYDWFLKVLNSKLKSPCPI